MNIKTFTSTCFMFLCIVPIQLDATNQFLDSQKISGADVTASAQFGYASDSDGDWAVIGAPSNAAGAVYIFNKQNDIWVETQKLTASDGVTGDNFGSAVVIEGNKLLIGSKNHQHSTATKAGAVYYFELNSGIWTQTQKIVNTSFSPLAQFGTAITISGNRAAIGEPRLQDSQDNGIVFTYEFNGENWSFESIITSPAGAPSGSGDWSFGRKLAIFDETLVISDYKQNGIGRVHIFTRFQNSWIGNQEIIASDFSTGQLFGTAIELENDILAVGAAGDGQDSGAVYIFSNNQSLSWTERAKLTPNDAVADGYFGGTDVNLKDDVLVVGAYKNTINNNNQTTVSGAVYVYENQASTWNQVQKITAVDGGFDDQFGISLTLNQSELIVGARYDDDNGSNSGSIYTFVNDLIFESSFE